MVTSACWEELGPTVVLVDALSRQLRDLRACGFSLPWSCAICDCNNTRTLGSCESCASKNEVYEAALNRCSLAAEADVDLNDHVLLLLARLKGPRCIEACFLFCEAMALESTEPDKAVWYYRRAFKQWPELDCDLCSDGVPTQLREEADSILATRENLSMHSLSPDIDPILGSRCCVHAIASDQQQVKDQMDFNIQRPPSQSAGSTQEPLAIIIPMRGRERQLKQLVPQLRSYLLKQEIAQFQIIVVEQALGQPYNKGLSLNVGVAYLLRKYPGFKYICFHDVDIMPTEEVDYSCSDTPTFLIGRRLLWEPEGHEEIPDDVVRSFEMLSDKTLGAPKELQNLRWAQARDRVKYGALLCPLQTFLAVNGWSNNFWGWGEEDVDFEERLKCTSKVAHRNGIFTSLDLGFHLFTSFGHRWCRLTGKCGGVESEVSWLDVAQVLNKDHARNTERRQSQNQRRQEAAEADAQDGFYSLDVNSLQLSDLATDGTYLHVLFDVSSQFTEPEIPDFLGAESRCKSLEAKWPAPSPLQGVKSRNRVIFELSSGKDARNFSLTLSSRVAVKCEADDVVMSLLHTETAKLHDDLKIIHLEPAGLSASRSQIGYAKAIESAVLEQRPQIIVVYESAHSGDSLWKDAFAELVGSEQLHNFGGAVVVCGAMNVNFASTCSYEQWVVDCGQLMRQS